MTPNPAAKTGISAQCSSVRLGVACKAMKDATTLDAVIAAKDKAKAAGLNQKDTQALRLAFDTAIARVRNLRHNQQPES